jgi:hypothetical protein
MVKGRGAGRRREIHGYDCRVVTAATAVLVVVGVDE